MNNFGQLWLFQNKTQVEGTMYFKNISLKYLVNINYLYFFSLKFTIQRLFKKNTIYNSTILDVKKKMGIRNVVSKEKCKVYEVWGLPACPQSQAFIHPGTDHDVCYLTLWKSEPFYWYHHKSRFPQQGCSSGIYS